MTDDPPILAVALASAAVASLVLLFKQPPEAETYIDDRESNAVHVLMNGSMVIMLTSSYTTAAETVIRTLYWIAAAALCARMAIRAVAGRGAGSSGRTGELGGSIYHLVAVGAMIYALRFMPGGMAMDAYAMPRHHGWLPALLSIVFFLDAAVSLVLVIIFPQHLLEMGGDERGGRARIAATSNPAARRKRLLSLRIALFPHVLMDLGMAYMLVMT